jgi:hypothetical protein
LGGETLPIRFATVLKGISYNIKINKIKTHIYT